MSQKKQRSTNFTFYEKELLLKHALQNRHVLENKESNAVTWKDKQKCWLKITELYNSETTGCPRDTSCLRSKYECVKKLLRGTKSDLFKTGGGPFKEPHIVSSDSEKTLYTILQPTIEGLPSPFDSDYPDFETTHISQLEPSKQNESMLIRNKENLNDNLEFSIGDECESTYVYDEILGLEDTLNTISETPEKTLQNIKENNQIIDDNLIHRQPSTSLCTSWSPLASTKLLRSIGKNDKLSTKFKKKNHCQTSVSEKFTILAEKKLELVDMQISFLKEQHEETMIFLKRKHELELASLELDIVNKKKNYE
ncbi:hypothetical protein QTP88_007896 [Uroleucon formosanum]